MQSISSDLIHVTNDKLNHNTSQSSKRKNVYQKQNINSKKTKKSFVNKKTKQIQLANIYKDSLISNDSNNLPKSKQLNPTVTKMYFEYEENFNSTVHSMNNALQLNVFNCDIIKQDALDNCYSPDIFKNTTDYQNYLKLLNNGYLFSKIIVKYFNQVGITVSNPDISRLSEISIVNSKPFTLMVGHKCSYFTVKKFAPNGKIWMFDWESPNKMPIPAHHDFLSDLLQFIKSETPIILLEIHTSDELTSKCKILPDSDKYEIQYFDFEDTTTTTVDNSIEISPVNKSLSENYSISQVELNFVNQMEKYRLMVCSNCSEGKITTNNFKDNEKCPRCYQKKSNTNYFSDPICSPGNIPAELRNYRLSFVEEQLISLVFVSQYIYARPGGSASSKGHCINFQQDISKIALELPRLAADIPIVIIRSPNHSNPANSIDLKVRRNHVEVWLRWLKANSSVPGYKNLVISKSNLDLLPDDGLIELKEIESIEEFEISLNTSPHDQQELIDFLSQSFADASITEEVNITNDKPGDPDSYDFLNPQIETGVVNKPNLQLEEDIITQALEEMIQDNNQNNLKAPILPYPSHSNEPLNEYNTPHLAAMAFPTLFPTGAGDPFDVNWRSNETKFLLKVRHLINYCEVYNNQREFRFSTHTRFILWIYNINYRFRTLSQGQMYLKHNPSEANMTINELKAKINDGTNNSVIKNIQRYMANIPGTPSYWYNCSKDAEEIIKQNGPPHAFVTWSYNNYHCPYLHSVLGIPENSPYEIVDQIMRSQPNVVNEFFTKKIKEFVIEYLEKHLKATPEFAGWYWIRYEWQFRDAIHAHGLVRFGESECDTVAVADLCIVGHLASLKEIKSSEDLEKIALGKLSEKALIDFHDKHISVDAEMSKVDFLQQFDKSEKKPMAKKSIDIKQQEKDKDLLDLIYLLQRHECKTGRCIKVYKEIEQPCRFKMPKDLSEDTHIEYVCNKNKDGTDGPCQLKVVLKRVNDNRISNFSKTVLYLWRSNHDWSFVTCLKKVLAYILKYASKSEIKSSIFQKIYKQVFEMADETTTDTHLALKQVMTKVLGERDITRNEAIHQLLGLDLHFSNITVIKTSLESSKSLSKNKYSNQYQLNDSYIDLYSNRFNSSKYSSIFGTKDINFIEFVKSFDSKKLNEDLKERRNPMNITVRVFQKFSSNEKNKDYWLHCKFQLLRYKPWRDNQLSILDGKYLDNEKGWIDAWHHFVKTDYAKIKIPSWTEALNKATTELDLEGSGNENEPLNMFDDEINQNNQYYQEDYMRLQSTKTDYQNSLNLTIDTKNNLNDFNSWSADKKFYTENELVDMHQWISRQITADKTENDPILRPIVELKSLNYMQLRAYNLVKRRLESKTQLLIRIEGEGGTGKSHLINALCRLIPTSGYRVCAPTGKAANLIGAITIHKLVSINPILKKPELDLTGDALKLLQKNFFGVTHIFCDEFSMIGAKTMFIIDSRCRQATGKLATIFGGLSVLLFGDPKQLPPVFDTALSNSNTKSQLSTILGGLATFRQFKYVIRLTKNHRQIEPSQLEFRGLLSRLRNGKCVVSDWDILKDRIKGLASNEDDFKDSLYLMYSKAQVHEHNMLKINQLSQANPLSMLCRIDARHQGIGAQTIKSDEFLGLYPYLILSRDSRVMLISNQWVRKGLTNGAMGTLRHFIFEDGSGPPSLPIAIIVEMDEGYNGPHLLNKPRYVPFNPISAYKENESGKMMERTQLPFILAFGITIHKCQGIKYF